MTQYLTRRELRELERSGKLPGATATEAPSDQVPVVAEPVVNEADVQASPVVTVDPQPPVFLSRRELRAREAAEAGRSLVEDSSVEASQVSEPSEPVPVVVPDVIIEAIAEVEAELPAPSEAIYSDISAADFTGSNLLAEPSTQSIVLDVAPEAISLPLDTLDGSSTGSIAILPDPTTGSLTGALDGLTVDAADRVDAVTGVITLVEPVSAMDVINQRVTVGVVPDEALRKGLLQSWAYGALGFVLVLATIIATVAIVNAVGE